MRRGLALAAAVIAAGVVGCLPRQTVNTSRAWLERNNPFAGPAAAGKVVVTSELIDQPAGDPYLNAGLWKTTGKPVPPEKAALLAENGVRVGSMTGIEPPEFLRLIHSEQATVNPTGSTVSVGDAKVVPVNGPLAKAAFAVAADIGAEPTAFDLPAAECGFAITPTFADGGRVKLAFEPRVQHGAKQGWLRPTADNTGFAWLEQKPLERFPKLAFDVTLGPDDFLVIGATEMPADKLGGAFFLTAADGRARQRVLVVRASRLAAAQ